MKVQELIRELEIFMMEYDYQYSKAKPGEYPDRVTVNVRESTRIACEELRNRLKGEYGKAKSSDYKYPDNLLYDLGMDPVSFNAIPDDGISCALRGLTDKEREVLKMRYEDGMTYEAVGKTYGVTRERVRQIEQKALRKLRHPAFKEIIWNGRKAIEEHAEAVRKLADETAELNKQIASMYSNRVRLKEICEQFPDVKEIIEDRSKNLNVDIVEMELSIRAYNCLARAGYKKVEDLVGMTTDRLMKVRNLGRKSMEEIIKKCHEWGIEVK